MQTIPEMVSSAADRFGDAEAIVYGPLRLTFTEIVERIHCAAGVFADLGVGKGDRVAVWAPNSAERIVAAFGLLTAGGVLVPVNTRFNPSGAVHNAVGEPHFRSLGRLYGPLLAPRRRHWSRPMITLFS